MKNPNLNAKPMQLLEKGRKARAEEKILIGNTNEPKTKPTAYVSKGPNRAEWQGCHRVHQSKQSKHVERLHKEQNRAPTRQIGIEVYRDSSSSKKRTWLRKMLVVGF